MTRRLAAASLGLAAGLALLELGLRTAGAAYFAFSRDGRNPDFSRVRILCVGESTTASEPGRDRSWPRQLEEMLNAGGPRYQVVNKGLGATNSAVILERLPGWLELYRPAAVVAMMGVNDNRWYGVLSAERSGGPAARLWRRLRIVRLLSYARNELSDRRWQEAPRGGCDLVADADRLSALAARGRLPEALALFERDLSGCAGHPALPKLGLRMGSILAGRGLRAQARAAMEKSYAAFFGGEAGYAYSPTQITAGNYRRLARLARAREAVLVALPYPTRSSRELRALLRGEEAGVVFGDNEGRFRGALSNSRYDELFRDRFAGGWGHATERGNRLIAEAAAEALRAAGL